MRIGFVEARDRTNFFAAIAARLSSHEIFWLIENHAYALSHLTNVTKLRYPRRRDLATAPLDDPLLQRVARSDRAVVYFKQSTAHYAWYLRQIEAWFDRVRPDVIFGEVSSFQAHITALVAERRGVPFLNPMSSRYPTGRFAFFRGDRMIPLGGDPTPIDEQWLEQTLDDIVHSRTAPDYMTIRHSPIRKFLTRTRMALEWLRGERYNLQSPFSFFQRGSARDTARAEWEAISESESRGGRPTNSSHRPRILYPLQMQPEVNLDVWGREHRDQPALIKDLAEFAERVGGELWIKPNPKSFHELSPELVSAVRTLDETHLLGHTVKMTEIVDDIELVITVSGTIAIERALKGDPVIVLLNDYANWIGYPALGSDLTIASFNRKTLVDAVELGASVKPIEVLRRLVSTSYPGVISEPSLTPGVMDEANVTRVVSAFEHVLGFVGAESH